MLCTSLAPKWLRKPLRSALIAPLLDGLNGEICGRCMGDVWEI